MPTLPSLTPYIRVALNQQCAAGYHLRPRVIFDHYLACVAEGSLLVEADGQSWELGVGDFLFIHPRETHSFRCYSNVPARLPHLHFDFFTQPDAHDIFVSFRTAPELREYDHLFRLPIRDALSEINLPTLIRPLHYEPLLDHLMKIIALQGRGTPASEIEQCGHFLLLLAALLHASQATEVYQNPRHVRAMEEAMEIIRRTFHQPLTLEDLAQAVHLSPSHFSHLFKQFYQISPIQFIRNYRIERVKHLLLTTDQTLTQIAEACGFSSIHVLSRVFKEVTNQSPSEFLRGLRTDSVPPPQSCPMAGRPT